MNKYKVGKFLILPLLCGTFEACDKFEAFPLEYKNTPQDDAVEIKFYRSGMGIGTIGA